MSSVQSRRGSPGSSEVKSPGLTPGLGKCPSSLPPCLPVGVPSSALCGSSLLPTALKGNSGRPGLAQMILSGCSRSQIGQGRL